MREISSKQRENVKFYVKIERISRDLARDLAVRGLVNGTLTIGDFREVRLYSDAGVTVSHVICRNIIVSNKK